MFSLQTMFGKNDKIFELLQASSEAAIEASRAVAQLTRDRGKVSLMATFSAARKREKQLSVEISEALINTFVTALDREDIEEMNSALYKIPKSIEKFAERYVRVARRLEGVDFAQRADILVSCTEVVAEMVKQMRKNLRIEPMRKLQDQLQALEFEADKLLLEPYSELYLNPADPMRAVLAKDLFETIEKAIDKCGDVGNVIYSIVLKNS